MADLGTPDRVDGLYWTSFSRDGDTVHLHLRGNHTLVEPLAFALPRQARSFENLKLALNAAFELGQRAAQQKIRDALGIEECSHVDD